MTRRRSFLPHLLTIFFLFSVLIHIIRGQTWTFQSASGLPSANWKAAAMSTSGQYMFVSGTNQFYQSQNFGSSWTKMNSQNQAYWGVACSASGQYVAVAGNSYALFVSNTYGTSNFVNANLPTGLTYTVYQIAMDSTGRYIVAVLSKFFLIDRSIDFDFILISFF